MNKHSRSTLNATLLISGIVCLSNISAINNVNAEETEIDTITVTGLRRLPQAIETFPGTVRTLNLEELEKQIAVNQDLGAILGSYVPGFSPSGSQTSGSNFDQTLRGRIPSVFIDGVPITTTLRNGRQDIRALHPSAIGAIEIVSGSTTLYGNGGAGGVINYVTKRPNKEELQISTKIGGDLSLTHLSDSFSPSVTQTASGDFGVVDVIVTAMIDKTQSFFDADGERIAPNPNLQIGLSDSLIYNLYSKIGFEQEEHRFEISTLYFKQSQDTDYINGVGNVADRTPTPAVIGENSPLEINNGNRNFMLNSVYTKDNLYLNTDLRIQAYYLDVKNTFSFSTFFPDGGQSLVNSSKYGARLDFDTDFAVFEEPGGRLLYGIDYLNDLSEQPLADGRTFVPKVRQKNIATFAQLQLPIGERINLSGGIRYEDFNLEVESFQALFSGANVTGGNINFSEPTYNVGSTFNLTEDIHLFTSYSQGASVAELGRVLRSAIADIDINTFNLEPSITNSLEFGIRYETEQLKAALVYFENKSTLGSTVTFNTETSEFIVSQAPEKVKGVEFSLDYNPVDDFNIGGNLTWMEGKRDTDEDGVMDTPLSGQTIPPLKITGYAEYNFAENWFGRGQISYTGNRNEFPGSTSFGQGKVNARAIIDLLIEYSLNSGKIQLGLHNALNKDYFTHTSEISQLANRFSKGPGRSISLNYTANY